MKHLPLVLAAFASLFSLATAAPLDVDKSKSKIGYDAKATGHSFSGTLKDYTVTAAGDPITNKPTDLQLSWSFKKLDSSKADRDEEMIKWLGGGDPKGSFSFTKLVNTNGADTVEGTLTINGVKKTIQFPLKVTKDGSTVTTKGSVTINYKDFSLPIIRQMLLLTVDPQVTINFTLVGTFK